LTLPFPLQEHRCNELWKDFLRRSQMTEKKLKRPKMASQVQPPRMVALSLGLLLLQGNYYHHRTFSATTASKFFQDSLT
jgi:hypothetical protein